MMVLRTAVRGREMQNAYLTKKEAAVTARLSLRTIDNLLSAKAIPFTKIGAAVRIPREQFFAFLESRTIQARPTR